MPSKQHLAELLDSAATIGDLDKVHDLVINKSAEIHSSLLDPFSSASEYGHVEVMEFFIDNGADIQTRNDLALRRACKSGRLESVEFLIDLGADVRVMLNTPIIVASTGNQVDVVKCLLRHGADPYALNNEPMRIAVKNGCVDVIKALFDFSPDYYRSLFNDDKELSMNHDAKAMLLSYALGKQIDYDYFKQPPKRLRL